MIRDSREHARRLFGRDRGFAQVAEPTWDDVQRRPDEYAARVDSHAEIDASSGTADEVAETLLSRIGVR